jgi:acyl dehydratase
MTVTSMQEHGEGRFITADANPRPGDRIADLTWVPSEVQLFRYSAVTWNAHRIHYDQSYARGEGYPSVLVQSHLHGALLTRLCTDWVQGHGYLQRLSVSVRRYAVPGDVLVCRGTVSAVHNDPLTGGTRVDLELEELRPADSSVCAAGQAQIVLLPGTDSGRCPVPVQPAPTSGPNDTADDAS